jgi:uncharacterized protein YkwD
MNLKYLSSIRFWLVVFCVAGFMMTAFAAPAKAQDDDAKEILALINKERSEKHLAPLKWDDRLGKAAKDYADSMAKSGKFSHRDKQGRTVSDRVRDQKVKAADIGENIYQTSDSKNLAKNAVHDWMKSPGHRANILSNTWETTGIGVAKAKNGVVYITQVFVRE